MSDVKTQYFLERRNEGGDATLVKSEKHDDRVLGTTYLGVLYQAMTPQEQAMVVDLFNGDLEDTYFDMASDMAEEETEELARELVVQKRLHDSTIRQLKRERDSHAKRVNRLNAIIKGKDEETGRLRYRAEGKQHQIDELEAREKRLREELTRVWEIVHKRDELVQRLNGINDELRAQLNIETSPVPREEESRAHTHHPGGEDVAGINHEHGGGGHPHFHHMAFGEVLDD